MELTRSSGILLHPTSLPGRFGIGEFGSEAYRFVDWLVEAGQKLWQTLPLGPTGYADSPYQSFSAFAGNPMLISLEKLLEQKLLKESDLKGVPDFSEDKVDFGRVIPIKMALLRTAFERWLKSDNSSERESFDCFCSEQSFWLDDFALFMAIKEAHGGVSWNEWPEELAAREPGVLDCWQTKLADALYFHRFLQYQFFTQWWHLKHYANERGVRIIGDIPIFVAYDSADTWANTDLFYLDEHLEPTVIAGVPPDYFSETGQRWGNPLYRWDAMAQRGYQWWIERFRQTFRLVNVVRVDHFRGFSAYWEVPASEPTAVKGQWVDGPGFSLFAAIQNALGSLPVIAEDLGLITPDVVALREAAGYPGMCVLQFGFSSDADNPYLPHNFTPQTVAYTGTHDNDTSLGWYKSATKAEKAMLHEYISKQRCDIAWEMMRLVMASVAKWAIVPLQDALCLGPEARMNIPGTVGGNWDWRFRSGVLTEELASALADMASLYGRQ